MNASSSHTQSLWQQKRAPAPSFRLKDSVSVDVCLIGAGVAGLTTAYLLLKAGRSVAVLDSGEIGAGETSRTTAHVTAVLDSRYFELERLHGFRGAQMAAESHSAAIEAIEEIIRSENISCGWQRVPGYLFLGEADDPEILENEYEAIERQGVLKPRWEQETAWPSLPGPCLRFDNQGLLHATDYLHGLARAVESRGGKIFTNAHVEKVEGAEGRVKLSGGRVVTASSIVVATNTPFNDWVVMHTKQAPYRTYVIGCRIPKGQGPRGLFWDTQDPYHYVRVQEGDDHDYLIIGGEDHKTGQEHNPAECFERLESWAREYFRIIESVDYRWSGQVLEPVDGLAFIGHNPADAENVYVITGASGNGFTYATLGAMLVKDLITGRENAWEKLYKPSRISPRATAEFLKENANVVRQYAHWFSKGEVESIDQLRAGEGALIRDGISFIAAYRSEEGLVHQCSAVCPHLGGIVEWNAVEKSWDCPCHGSRFDVKGQVIFGPANANLKTIEGKTDAKRERVPQKNGNLRLQPSLH